MQGEEIEMSLRVLRSHGWSITTLAREYGLNWRTVKRAVESEEPRRYLGRAKPTALTPAHAGSHTDHSGRNIAVIARLVRTFRMNCSRA